jgi:hypothetical protein
MLKKGVKSPAISAARKGQLTPAQQAANTARRGISNPNIASGRKNTARGSTWTLNPETGKRQWILKEE